MGLSTGSHDKESGPRGFEWVVYDLDEGTQTAQPFELHASVHVPLGGALLYGCVTRDDLGRFYLAGRLGPRKPVVVRVQCP
jgi:hypothetical protein